MTVITNCQRRCRQYRMKLARRRVAGAAVTEEQTILIRRRCAPASAMRVVAAGVGPIQPSIVQLLPMSNAGTVTLPVLPFRRNACPPTRRVSHAAVGYTVMGTDAVECIAFCLPHCKGYEPCVCRDMVRVVQAGRGAGDDALRRDVAAVRLNTATLLLLASATNSSSPIVHTATGKANPVCAPLIERFRRDVAVIAEVEHAHCATGQRQNSSPLDACTPTRPASSVLLPVMVRDGVAGLLAVLGRCKWCCPQ